MNGATVTNKQGAKRQLNVDMAKAFAILTMVLVHVFESVPIDNCPYWLNYLVELLGGPLSAPVFMIAMGIGMAYARQQDASAFGERGKGLLRQAYSLNIWRGVAPCVALYAFTTNPQALITLLEHLLWIDILHFAAIAFLTVALLKKLGARDVHMLAIAILMQVVATLVQPFVEDSIVFSGVVGFFLYQNGRTSFSLFSWFIYPAAGYCFGNLLRRTDDLKRLYTRVLAISTALLTLCFVIMPRFGFSLAWVIQGDGYYQQTLARLGWIFPICGVLYALLYFLCERITSPRVRTAVEFLGSHVNQIYIAQWIIIGWPRITWLDQLESVPGWWFPLFFLIALVASVGLVVLQSRHKAAQAK